MERCAHSLIRKSQMRNHYHSQLFGLQRTFRHIQKLPVRTGSDPFTIIQNFSNWERNLPFSSPPATELWTEHTVQFRMVRVRTEVRDWTSPPLLSNPLYADKHRVQIFSNPLFWDKVQPNFGSSNPLFLDKKWRELLGASPFYVKGSTYPIVCDRALVVRGRESKRRLNIMHKQPSSWPSKSWPAPYTNSSWTNAGWLRSRTIRLSSCEPSGDLQHRDWRARSLAHREKWHDRT